MQEVTRLLQAWQGGDREALDRLVPLVYEDLRRMALASMRRERGSWTLQPTALVHEAYLRLVDAEVEWQSRAHFFHVAGRLMRRLLVDEARRRKRQKRGGGRPLSLEDLGDASMLGSPEALLELEVALGRLEKVAPRKTQVLEARLFAGLSIDETACVLELSTATVERDLRFARTWLARELLGEGGGG